MSALVSMEMAHMTGAAEDDELDDEDLMRAWQAGDESAFAVLVDRYGGPLHGFLLHLLGNATAAEEAWSETFMKVVRSKDRYTDDGRFRAWLYTVARRCALDQRRSNRRWMRLVTRVTERAPPPAAPLAADTLIGEGQRSQAVADALAKLSDEHRTALLLTYRQDLSSREVSEVMGLTSQQVRNKVAYARRLLGEMLPEEVADGTRG